MAKGNTISGAKALAQMRALKHSEQTFQLYHLTWNQKKGISKGMRKVSDCRLRHSLPKEALQFDSDHYLLYYDEALKEPRMCFKKLARYVAFPPHYELLKIDWF